MNKDLKKFILKREQRKVLQVKLYIVIFTHQVILKNILKMECTTVKLMVLG